MSITSNGYVCVPRCVDERALCALRLEANHLFRLKKAQDSLSEDEYFDKGCALDFFTNTELPEEHEARLSMDAYMSERNRARLPRGPKDNRNISNPCDKAREATKRNSETSAAVTIPSNELTTWDDRHVSVVREVIFGTLARLAWEALRSADEFSAARSQKAQESAAVVGARPRGTAGKEELRRPLLFNEQYVVKPPQSSIEFGWHTDEREQLAMCVFAPGVQPPVYVSVWLALDDCDAANGCLEVYPQACDGRHQQPPGKEDGAVQCLPSNSGDAVVFLSNVWHRSGPNRTANPRRVFYAQYSTDVVRATPSDPRPLSLAVPCCLEALSSNNTAALCAAEQLEAPESQDKTTVAVEGTAVDLCSAKARELEGAGVDTRSVPLRGAKRRCLKLEVDDKQTEKSTRTRASSSKRVRETGNDVIDIERS